MKWLSHISHMECNVTASQSFARCAVNLFCLMSLRISKLLLFFRQRLVAHAPHGAKGKGSRWICWRSELLPGVNVIATISTAGIFPDVSLSKVRCWLFAIGITELPREKILKASCHGKKETPPTKRIEATSLWTKRGYAWRRMRRIYIWCLKGGWRNHEKAVTSLCLVVAIFFIMALFDLEHDG
jgi:hypothetical protein